MKRIAILISGNGTNMTAIIRQAQAGILKGLCDVVLVASNKPEALGLKKAEALGIPTACVPSADRTREAFEEALLERLAEASPDYIVLAGFMRILSPLFIEACRGKIINIHPADTRAYQGAHGYTWAWNSRLKETFVTVHYVDEGVDTGPIIMQVPVDLKDCKSLEAVQEAGLLVEHRVYSEALYELLNQEASVCAVS